MNDKILKKLKFFIILLLVSIVVIIVTIIQINKYNIEHENNKFQNQGENVVENYGSNNKGGIDFQSYFDIKLCMEKYLKLINILDVDENIAKKKIYDILSSKYISKNKITTENIYNYVKVLQESAMFVPIEASLVQDSDIKSFLISGLIESTKDYRVIDRFFGIININFIEGNFSIEPIYEDYNSINETKIEEFEKSIISNEENKFSMANLKASDIPVEYMNLYKGLALGYPEKIYDLLDNDYREARFKNVDEFKQYVQNNKEMIKNIILDDYSVITKNDEIEYICVDKKNNYYIIRQKEILQDYKLLLDIYTIDIPQFVEGYNKSKEDEKVLLNIQKIITATKVKDYKYVYNKLDSTFKASNFATQADFEKYIKEKYKEEDKITFTTYEKINDVHIYGLEITKGDGNVVKAQVVMQLKEGTDFAMSFSAVK